MITPEQIVTELRGKTFPVLTEDRLQFEIAAYLTKAGIPFEREKRLDGDSRIDFLCDWIGIEVNTRHPWRQTFRQLERYAKHPDIKALILVTRTFMGLTEEIEGVPIYMVSLGRAAL